MKTSVVMLTVSTFFITIYSMKQLESSESNWQGKPRSKSVGEISLQKKKTITKFLLDEEKTVQENLVTQHPKVLANRMTVSDPHTLLSYAVQRRMTVSGPIKSRSK